MGQKAEIKCLEVVMTIFEIVAVLAKMKNFQVLI